MWTICWKCNEEINTQAECNYIKIRYGNFSLCPSCYKEFLEHNNKFLLPEKSIIGELDRFIYCAIGSLHDQIMENKNTWILGPGNDVKATLIHNDDRVSECKACQQVLKYINDKKIKE